MLIICIILGMALATVVVWLSLLKRDIRQLGTRLADIAETDTNAQLTTNTFDKDIASLSDSINRMLERSRIDLMDKVRAEADLKRAVTNISHDLRTPLTSALGYLQMLDSSGLDIEARARYLETVRERLEALSGLMNSLFEFTRVMEGNLPFDIKNGNVCNVLRNTLSANYAELAAKGFTVDADIPDTPVYCLYDEEALCRVLQNLLKNVCVHGQSYLRVTLNGCIIEIANKTSGLDELDTRRIFERFYTADASRTSKNTGLGLAIAKELVTRMGGRITADAVDEMLVIRVFLR